MSRRQFVPDHPCRQCGKPMDPDRAWFWTGYGATCSEGCARDLIRDHEGGITPADRPTHERRSPR